MTAANRNSWKTLPFPAERQRIEVGLLFSDADAEQMAEGHIPQHMDDKWFIYSENGWLYFHRSWTGHCIYAVKLDGSPAGVRISDAFVNWDKREYSSPGLDADIKIIEQLIRTKLLS